jgi:hypothetical protein
MMPNPRLLYEWRTALRDLRYARDDLRYLKSTITKGTGRRAKLQSAQAIAQAELDLALSKLTERTLREQGGFSLKLYVRPP